jgi:hypothetical protein
VFLTTILLLGTVPKSIAGQPVTTSWQFALSLGSTTEGQMFSLFVVKVNDQGKVLETRPVSRDNFIRQIQGRTFSQANPDAEDLFRKYGVKQCTLPEDSAAMGFLTDCSTLDDLWKLRFWEYPLKLQSGQNERVGWSAKKLTPDERQMMLLGGYGMTYLMDLVIGENMFRLLRDMGDPEWVQNYRSGL